MVTQAPDAAAIKAFADAIGEWLLTQRFGQITPLAYAHSLWEPRPDDRLDGELPHLVIDLLVADPPPPPPEWHRLNEKRSGDMSLPEIGEWARAQLWPREDMQAVDEAARTYAAEHGLPPGVSLHPPLTVRLLARSEAAATFPSCDG